MGRSITPAHRIEVIDLSGHKWQTVFEGKATQESLENWVLNFNNSVSFGHNAHLGENARVREARVVSQKGPRRGQVIVEYNS